MSSEQEASADAAGEGVPERIWIPVNSNCPAHPKDRWLIESERHETDVEYVRADLARAYSPTVDEA